MVSFAVTKHPRTAPNQLFALSPCVYLGQPVVDIRGLNLWNGYFFWRTWVEVECLMVLMVSDGVLYHHRRDFSFVSLFLSCLIQRQFRVGNWRNDIKCWTRPTLGSQTIVSLWQSVSPQRGEFSAERKVWKKEEVGGKGVTKRQRVLVSELFGSLPGGEQGKGIKLTPFKNILYGILMYRVAQLQLGQGSTNANGLFSQILNRYPFPFWLASIIISCQANMEKCCFASIQSELGFLFSFLNF